MWLYALLLFQLIRRRQQRQRRWLALATQPIREDSVAGWIVSTDNSNRYIPTKRHQTYQFDIDSKIGMSEHEFRQHYRFSKVNFEHLCSDLTPHWPPTLRYGRPPLPMKQCVLMVLERLANNIDQHIVGERYGMGQTSVNKWTGIVFDCVIAALIPTYLRWPTTTAERQQIADGFKRRAVEKGYRHMPGCAGAMDGTHIELATVPSFDGDAYRCWKKFVSINVLAVCDANGRFIHLTVGWPGSTNDIALQQHSTINNDLRYWNNGDYLIADGGFTLTPTVVIPYRNTPDAKSPQGKFNNILKDHRGCIERAFGRLKQRWRCLFRLSFKG